MKNLRLFAVVLWACALCIPITSGQDQGSVSFRVQSKTVLVDLIVTDREGNFVTDLKKGEIEVKEDGKAQSIEYFELVRASAEAAQASAEDNVVPSNPIEFGSPSSAASIILAVDLGGVSHGDLGFVKESVRSFMENEAGGGSRFMLATVGASLQVRQAFTSNPAEILEKMDSMQTGNPERFQYISFLEEVDQVFRSAGAAAGVNITQLLQFAQTAAQRGSSFVTTLENQVRAVSDDIALLSRHVSSLPGRKHLVLYSSGYLLDPVETIRDMITQRVEGGTSTALTGPARSQLSVAMSSLRRTEMPRLLNKAIDMANRAQVSIYSIDPRGLVPSSGDPRQTISLADSSRGDRARWASADITHPQDFLVSVSEGTGGLPFFNSNDLERGLKRAHQDLREYYLFSYQPSSKRKKDRFHKIEVKINRKDLEIRHRTGYVDIPDEDLVLAEVYNALAFPWLFDYFEPALQVTPGAGKLNVAVGIPTQALNFSLIGDSYECPVETYATLVDDKGKQVGKSVLFAKTHRMRYDAEGLSQVRAVDYVTMAAEADAPAGKYHLVVIVRQGFNSEIGSAVQEVTIP